MSSAAVSSCKEQYTKKTIMSTFLFRDIFFHHWPIAFAFACVIPSFFKQLIKNIHNYNQTFITKECYIGKLHVYVMSLHEANPVGNRLPVRVTDYFRMEFMTDDHFG